MKATVKINTTAGHLIEGVWVDNIFYPFPAYLVFLEVLGVDV